MADKKKKKIATKTKVQGQIMAIVATDVLTGKKGRRTVRTNLG